MYIVPTEIPKYCNDCPFGMTNYIFPLWANEEKWVSAVDGKENKRGTYGYTCNIERQKNGKYTKVLRAGLEEDIKKPKWCGLKEV